MFKLAKNRQVWWPVKLTTYDEAGKEKPVQIRALFRLYSREERAEIERRALDELRTRAAELQAERERQARGEIDQLGVQAADMALAKLDEHIGRSLDHVEQLVGRVSDWRGVQDEAGADVPFSPDVLRDLLRYEDVLNAFLAAFAEATRGAVAKN